MHPGIIWLIAGLALLILELFTTTMFLMWIGAGALVTALAAVWVDPPWVQWLIFAVVSTILLLATRRLARSIHGQVTVPSNVDQLVGQIGVLLEAVDPQENTGRIRVGSEEWRARSDARIPQGVRARVERIEGTTLWVTQVFPEPVAPSNSEQ
jgi:membrane protein implicated in regulation of membrane protease activity